MIETIVFDVGETITRDDRYWASWADWLGVPRHTLSALVGAVVARGSDNAEALRLVRPGLDVAAEYQALAQARTLADQVPEGVYCGTVFGPDSVKIHVVSVAVGLGDEHVGRALDVARQWKPPHNLPAERRSAFYIELARAQLWAGLADDAFESLKVARYIAPQHTREHPWVREDAATLRRLKRADAESLTNFAEWCAAT
ncbi:hypothetical protein [Streptomyces griseoflavus]|uniref:hypothetical protein n=1 Tax=Streptomyces griseoflavus TaxID=35619 RepID=UPI003D764435